jgi:hypothetical protein
MPLTAPASVYRLFDEHVERYVREYEERYEAREGSLRKVGFARIRCPNCRAERLLAFSCRTCNFCRSCQAKCLTVLRQTAGLGARSLDKRSNRATLRTISPGWGLAPVPGRPRSWVAAMRTLIHHPPSLSASAPRRCYPGWEPMRLSRTSRAVEAAPREGRPQSDAGIQETTAMTP